MLQLKNTHLQVQIDPQDGGRINTLEAIGLGSIFYPTQYFDHRPPQGGSYPLIPYSSRIQNGSFSFKGKDFNLPAHPIAIPHSLHGVGWLKPWEVATQTATQATIKLTHQADSHWPWSFEATQTFTLKAATFKHEMHITNTSDEAFLAGLGFHPFFSTANLKTLCFNASHQWIWQDTGYAKDHLIPTKKIPITSQFDFSTPKGIDFTCDNALSGWDGELHLEYKDFKIAMYGDSKTSNVVMFANGETPFVCFEPVTHPINAHATHQDTLKLLEVGEKFGVEMTIVKC